MRVRIPSSQLPSAKNAHRLQTYCCKLRVSSFFVALDLFPVCIRYFPLAFQTEQPQIEEKKQKKLSNLWRVKLSLSRFIINNSLASEGRSFRENLNIDWAPIASKSHSPVTLTNISFEVFQCPGQPSVLINNKTSPGS